MLLYFQDSRFRCLICTDQYFRQRFDVTRHIEKKHSGFSYKCSICFKVLMRNGAHSKCTGSKRDMVLFHRDTGARGPEAQAMYDQYMNIKMPNLWEECLQPPPRPISPCREDLLWKGCIHHNHPIKDQGHLGRPHLQRKQEVMLNLCRQNHLWMILMDTWIQIFRYVSQ